MRGAKRVTDTSKHLNTQGPVHPNRRRREKVQKHGRNALLGSWASNAILERRAECDRNQQESATAKRQRQHAALAGLAFDANVYRKTLVSRRPSLNRKCQLEDLRQARL